MSHTPPPLFNALVEEMAFNPGDPEFEFAFAFMNWGLDDKYPITIGEMLLSITAPLGKEENGDQEGGQEPGTAAASSGSGTVVPGGSENGDPVGEEQPDRSDPDPGGTSPVSSGGSPQAD